MPALAGSSDEKGPEILTTLASARPAGRGSARCLRHDERGAAAVEFALLLPLLFALVFGIIWFGFVFHRWITVTHAAREGVRAFALSGDPADGRSAGNAALAGLSGASCDAASPSSGPVGSGTQVSITCAAPYPPPLFIFSRSGSLSSVATMRRE